MIHKTRWYEDSASDISPIISSRVRLARNLSKYPFSAKINDEQSEKLIKDVISSIKNDYMSIGSQFEYVDIKNADGTDKRALIEKHSISPELLKYSRPRGVLIKEDESVEIMINEEDHIRIQSVYSGKNIDAAWDTADKIDDLMEETLEYAFDSDFGYLTSCPTNTGTGLRASYMVHIPMLEKTGNIQSLAAALSKLGMTIRGIYGEGSESYGSIYQVSNQMTLGKSEEEIIQGLKTIGEQIEDNESKVFKNIYSENPIYVEDNIYRAYGLLKNARKMTVKEAMNLLSAVRTGYIFGILKEPKPKAPIYNIMMNIEPGNIQKRTGESDSDKRDIARASYLREIFN
ncbi:MAG: protein arginine kinase [Lachnospiraceae bacterium]|jgi:protein arginine kinase|nr:protein arginine kinase [Lachnospiraceae bacterium]